ncbi:hypothetical protein SODALDRAFT_364476 [Sodiomyces alkalinus F11]|uniref:Uncharacterized protein n=1 Tax=Sodiomyces alkalinus (strain CBS 110278 / VKM F-3762 / F11) TaxID=1314773 RepID=A0A3N2PJ32_SODAK|nr:hypothetical protein SODALDRAFT_364476 [Sodiomyces alkalinus F11]ROT34548.1 hypothetical protein SODALDRAFT_364476 [Sodiomyces alkalinus F11]
MPEAAGTTRVDYNARMLQNAAVISIFSSKEHSHFILQCSQPRSISNFPFSILTMAAEAEAQRATLDKFIDGWRRSSAADMVATWSADSRNSTEVMATLPMLQKVVTEYKHKAAVYALSTGKTPFGDWTNDYAVFFTFNESGTEIVKLEEMVDSAFMKEFFPKFQGFMREQASKAQPV